MKMSATSRLYWGTPIFIGKGQVAKIGLGSNSINCEQCMREIKGYFIIFGPAITSHIKHLCMNCSRMAHERN